MTGFRGTLALNKHRSTKTFLIALPAEEPEAEEEEATGEQYPMYEEGRGARILDMMHRDGIIGPPDGSNAKGSAEAAGLAAGSGFGEVMALALDRKW